MNTEFTKCRALKQYIDYWNDWHKMWYASASSKSPLQQPIKNWPIPVGNGGNQNAIWRYFPEPYWGNPNPTALSAVFLNLNPGQGGDNQDVTISSIDPIATYIAKHHVYGDTIDILVNNPNYPTTGWFNKKRVNWVNTLTKGNNITIRNIIAGELVPWHTKNINEIKKYTAANLKLIESHCLKPIADISQCASLKGVVFAKGAEIRNLLTNVATKKGQYSSINKFSIDVFDCYGAIFIVFVGGRTMDLPNLGKVYTSLISRKIVSVQDIVNGCLNHHFV